MSKLNQLRGILRRKVKINVMDQKTDARTIDINLKEVASEMNCTSSDVLTLLRRLNEMEEIKRLIPNGLKKDDYMLTVQDNSSI